MVTKEKLTPITENISKNPKPSKFIQIKIDNLSAKYRAVFNQYIEFTDTERALYEAEAKQIIDGLTGEEKEIANKVLQAGLCYTEAVRQVCEDKY